MSGRSLGAPYREHARPGELAPGDVVQLDPDHPGGEEWGGCLMVVTEPTPWGAKGYVATPGPRGGPAPYRASHEQMVRIGHAEWTRPRDEPALRPAERDRGDDAPPRAAGEDG